MFAAKVEGGREGEDGEPSLGPVYRNVLAKDEFPPMNPDLSTIWELLRASVEKHPNNRMLGWRELVNGKWGPFVWKTYSEVFEEILQAGSALRAHGVEPGASIGIYGANCPQWIVAMEACTAHSLVCVPLYDTLGSGAVNFIIGHAEVDVAFVQDKKVKEVRTIRKHEFLVLNSTYIENLTVKSYCFIHLVHKGREGQGSLHGNQTVLLE